MKTYKLLMMLGAFLLNQESRANPPNKYLRPHDDGVEGHYEGQDSAPVEDGRLMVC